jgi:tetratricopeptide (TPR) repeat protein
MRQKNKDKMYNKDIELFKEALIKANNEFYLDSISSFNELIHQYPESDLVDDAYFNIGLCYFEMNHFVKAIEIYNLVINDYPDSTISSLEDRGESGKTAAKCHYAILNCFLALNNLKEATIELEKVKNYTESFVKLDDKRITFYQLALHSLKIYNQK